MGWGRRRGSISKGSVPGRRDSAPPHASRAGRPSQPPPRAQAGRASNPRSRARAERQQPATRAPGRTGGRGPARPGPATAEGRAGWEGHAGHSAGPTRGPRPAATGPRGNAPVRPKQASGGRAGDGTKAPLLRGGRRRVTHNGGGSRRRRRRRRRARRGALPSRPAGAPRTRTHIYSRDFSDSSRECGAHGQPPVSAQVSSCAGGSSVSEVLALPQSPPCNPDPRERARKRGRGLLEPRPSRHRLTPWVPPPPPGPALRHAPEFPTPVTEPSAPRGRQERHKGLSAASGVLGRARGLTG